MVTLERNSDQHFLAYKTATKIAMLKERLRNKGAATTYSRARARGTAHTAAEKRDSPSPTFPATPTSPYARAAGQRRLQESQIHQEGDPVDKA
jgi:hypothetical protein